MSAPVTERPRSAATIPAQRGAPAIAPRRRDGGTAGVPTAAQKAYARRDDRLRRLVGGAPARTTAPAGRAQFVLLVMVLLATGLVATLWLSTAAAADSYRLQDARAMARTLSEQGERLHREVAAMGSAPELARRATELGMVPVQDPARLVVGPDGEVTVVGQPQPATVPAPPVPPADAASPAPLEPPADEPALPPAGAPEPPADPVEQLAGGVQAGPPSGTGTG